MRNAPFALLWHSVARGKKQEKYSPAFSLIASRPRRFSPLSDSVTHVRGVWQCCFVLLVPASRFFLLETDFFLYVLWLTEICSGRNRLLDQYFVTSFLGKFVSNY